MEVAKFTMAKKSTSSSQQCQVHVDLFFFNIKGIVHKEFIPLVKPSMASFTVRFWSGWGNTSLVVCCSTIPDFQKHYSDPPPPYSPDLAPCDFFLFPKMKVRLKQRRFDTTEEIHVETQEVIDTLTFQNFQGCMKSWETRWDCCIHAQVDYFKRDGGN